MSDDSRFNQRHVMAVKRSAKIVSEEDYHNWESKWNRHGEEKHEVKRKAGKPKAPPGGAKKFIDACRVYRAQLHREGKLNVDTARRIEDLMETFGSWRIREIGVADIRTWAHERFKGRSVATLNRNIGVFNSIMQAAYNEGWIDKVPEYKRRVAKDTRDHHLEPHEIVPFVKAVERLEGPGLAMLALFLIDTGARFNEAMLMRWRDLGSDWTYIGRHKDRGRKSLERSVPTSPRLMGYMMRHGLGPDEDAELDDYIFGRLS